MNTLSSAPHPDALIAGVLLGLSSPSAAKALLRSVTRAHPPSARRSANWNHDMAARGNESYVVDSDDTRYMDRAIEAWCWWQHGVGPQEPVSMGKLLRISDGDSESVHLLELTDDQFTLVDKAIARLDAYGRRLIEIEYNWGGSKRQKATHLGLTRDEYNARVASMLAGIYFDLMPAIETWRESVL